MNKMIKSLVLATSLAAAFGVAAKDKSPLSKVYAVQEMQYDYVNAVPGEAQVEARRFETDRMIRAIEVINSGVSASLKQFAIDELVGIPRDEATRGLAEAYRQAQALKNIGAETYVANAIWRHSAQRQFKSREASALVAKLGSSKYARVRAVGAVAKADAISHARRNAD